MKFALIFFLLNLSLSSENQYIQLNDDMEALDLGKRIEYFIDEENKISLENITDLEIQSLFLKNKSNIPEFGYQENQIWLKLSIMDNSALPENWYLEIQYPLIDSIEICTKENNIWKIEKTGDEFPFLSRKVFYRNFIFGLSFPAKEVKTYYIKIKTSSAVIIPLRLYKEKYFSKMTAYTEAWHFIYYGVLFVMIFYNGFISISLRSFSYLLYSLSTLSMLSYQIMFNGHGFQYLWQNSIWLQKYMGLISIIFFAIFTIEFMIRFLNLRNTVRLLIRTLLLIQNIIIQPRL